jgi:uncharacterized protein YecE (DUF72 family)
MMRIFIGCAGWALAREYAANFSDAGSHLARYSQRFNAVEVNSSFYRPHLRKTYTRWAASTPPDFRFSVKVPKLITHQCRLVETDAHVDRFLDETGGLGEKLGPLLVQLPPSLKYDAGVVAKFFQSLRQRVASPIVCEARHRSWFTAHVEQLFKSLHIARAIVDPPPVPAGAELDELSELRYFRLHGSPRVYYSSYDRVYLAELARRLLRLAASGGTIWCIFDNTALGAAVENALAILEEIAATPESDRLRAGRQF